MMKDANDETISDLLILILHLRIVNCLNQWDTINVCWCILIWMSQFLLKNNVEQNPLLNESPSLVWASSRMVGNQSMTWFKTVFTGFISLLVEVTSNGTRTPPFQLVSQNSLTFVLDRLFRSKTVHFSLRPSTFAPVFIFWSLPVSVKLFHLSGPSTIDLAPWSN